MRVVERLRTAGERGADVLSAAALHDVIEDCGVKREELESRFGARVARLVGDLTRAKEQSFAQYLAQLQESSREAKVIKLSDRLDNVREMRLFGVSSFGEMPVAEYLLQSKEVVEICGDASRELASALADEIVKAEGAGH